MNTIVVCETSSAFGPQVQSVLAGLPGTRVLTTDCLIDAEDVVRAQAAELLLLGPSLVNDEALELAARLRADCRTATVMLVEAPDTEFMRRALRAGVADVIPLDAPRPEIVDMVTGALDRVLAEKGNGDGEDTTHAGKVVTVFSTKGGVGKTVLATNLACGLAKYHERSVAIIDLDLQFGDVGIMMSITPERTVYDAVQSFERLDVSMLQGYLMQHPSGVKALLAPTKPEDAEGLTAHRLSSIIRLLRTVFDFIVIDTAPAFNDVTLAALDASDLVYVVTMMDVASVKNTRISLQKLRQLGYDQSSMRLVLNRADSKVFMNVDDVEEAVGDKISGRIPSDLLVPRSVNRGMPLVLEAPKTRVAKAILAVVDDVLAQSASRDGGAHVA